ncbi:hypothetical protein [Nitrosomonas sp.]|uniref:hypothetical protein n=1 Tax=Nitrosomonas sp. TaxID=42353 RepID=UPI0025EC1596|nr:hypothetical protein [Nitrosomonas sp.]
MNDSLAHPCSNNLEITGSVLSNRLQHRDLPQADYVFASGVLNYRYKTEHCHADMIRKRYNSARIALAFTLAFNILDKSSLARHDLLIGHDP